MPNRSVLIVDDDEQFAQIMCAALRLRGVTPVCVSNMGAAALELTQRDFEVVLLDLNLPDSTPDRTVQAIRRILAWNVNVVVVITGLEVAEPLERVCLANGAKAVLSKSDRQFMEKVLAYATG